MSAQVADVHQSAQHVVQFYDDDPLLIAEVGRAMCVALDQGSAVLCVATHSHRRLLQDHLQNRGIDVPAAMMADQIVFMDAHGTLAKITRRGMPDVIRFAEVVGAVVDRLAARYPRVWIFGELVALMCANGNHSGAVELERLWTSFADARPVFLHCGYPAQAFSSEQDLAAFRNICEEHCRVLHCQSSLALSVRRNL
jgi:hypothetical protein